VFSSFVSFIIGPSSTSINFPYSTSGFDTSTDKIIVSISTFAYNTNDPTNTNGIIYTTATSDAISMNGSITLSETIAGITFFPYVFYYFRFRVLRPCGLTNWSPGSSSIYANNNRIIVPPTGNNTQAPIIPIQNSHLYSFNNNNGYGISCMLIGVGYPPLGYTSHQACKGSLASGITLNAGIKLRKYNDDYDYSVTPYEANSRLTVYVFRRNQPVASIHPNYSSPYSVLLTDVQMAIPTIVTDNQNLPDIGYNKFNKGAVYNIPISDLSSLGLSVGTEITVVFWTQRGSAASGNGMSSPGAINLTVVAN